MTHAPHWTKTTTTNHSRKPTTKPPSLPPQNPPPPPRSQPQPKPTTTHTQLNPTKPITHHHPRPKTHHQNHTHNQTLQPQPRGESNPNQTYDLKSHHTDLKCHHANLKRHHAHDPWPSNTALWPKTTPWPLNHQTTIEHQTTLDPSLSDHHYQTRTIAGSYPSSGDSRNFVQGVPISFWKNFGSFRSILCVSRRFSKYRQKFKIWPAWNCA